ncbi:MAG: B12-binding domain-containing radical SAM protein [Nitrospina sp.]|jgi:anaerobic magnesium-protoporphyrin IX monomethyl ester cyclase|nr:B12-binding domain-containing radical SAM protein [Nitrospina sp.]MBT3855656.1 B12-binding domain-containing radical SAM protein [Nitrospina sp.]MBT4104474.1 B12-binding domain-containing radical SAM protein [Nitrospina sp.]MBT4390359.1 B12-binding domain-containing radical SAM protein [Nitrospina sp.]MBT4622158.1 B12-binding domain-containing radical SAM protein [Nitrospina sp.]
MNIGLISPYPDIQSFGLRTLSACLKQEGHNVKIVFLLSQFWDKYEDQPLNETVDLLKDCDLIGLSVMSNFWDNSVQITERLKKDIDAPIIWGGTHPTIRPEECIERGGADIVCIGEGEETLIELASKMENGDDYSSIEGIGLKDNGETVINKTRPLTVDLDVFPFQDYDFETHYVLDGNNMDNYKYGKANDHLSKMTLDLLKKHSMGDYVTMPTRGCPFGCTFCVNDTLNKMYAGQPIIRKRSMGNLMKELKEIKKNLPYVNNIYFDDDSFILLSTEQIKEFSEEYKEHIDLPLSVTGITPSTLRKDKLTHLVDAGVQFIRMGLQSGNEAIKEDYKRNYSNKKVESSVAIINEFKEEMGPPQYDIILDNPWETDENLEETLMFLTKLPAPYRLGFYSLTFYPETELYDKAKKDGIIKDGFVHDLNDVYRKTYNGIQKTYLNRIFFLLSASMGTMSTRTMSLLLNKKVRKLKLGMVLYAILSIKYAMLSRLILEALKDLKKGEFYRLKRWFFRKIPMLRPMKGTL